MEKSTQKEPVKSAVLSIGDEILIGQIVNTNAAWISGRLTDLGFDNRMILTVGDTPQAITDGLDITGRHAGLIIVTGGLGPTADDLTRETIARFFGRPLEYRPEVEAHIRKLFDRMNYPFTDNNKSQAMVPRGTEILPNFYGTAPGMWIEHKGKIYVFLPGVPFEMKHIFTEELEPRLKERFRQPALVRKTVAVYGIGESLLAHRLKDWEAQLPPQIHLAYLPSPKRIRLRLQMRSERPEEARRIIDEQIEKLRAAIPDLTITVDTEDLAPVVHRRLKEAGQSLAVAESCTGGHVMAALVDIPGASKFLKGGVVAYAVDIKEKVLGVEPALVEKYSVVSEAVARAMAEGVRRLFGTDWAVATTGNAGPDKGQSDARVGTCVIAIAGPKGSFARTFLFGQPREKAIQRTMSKAYELLLGAVEGKESDLDR